MVKIGQLGTNNVGTVGFGKKKKGITNRTRTILLIIIMIAGITCIYFGYQWTAQSNTQIQQQTSLDNQSSILPQVTININLAATPTPAPAPASTQPPLFSIP